MCLPQAQVGNPYRAATLSCFVLLFSINIKYPTFSPNVKLLHLSYVLLLSVRKSVAACPYFPNRSFYTSSHVVLGIVCWRLLPSDMWQHCRALAIWGLQLELQAFYGNFTSCQWILGDAAATVEFIYIHRLVEVYNPTFGALHQILCPPVKWFDQSLKHGHTDTWTDHSTWDLSHRPGR